MVNIVVIERVCLFSCCRSVDMTRQHQPAGPFSEFQSQSSSQLSEFCCHVGHFLFVSWLGLQCVVLKFSPLVLRQSDRQSQSRDLFLRRSFSTWSDQASLYHCSSGSFLGRSVSMKTLLVISVKKYVEVF